MAKDSKSELKANPLVTNIVGDARPFHTEDFGDNEVLFYDLNDGVITYAYEVDGKVNTSSIIKQSVDGAPGMSNRELDDAKREKSVNKILDLLNGKDVKLTYNVD